MATKETMIVFVYDTECLKDEADDPVNAVLYFHPSWVSDTQKVALCGQLMGTSYFLNDCFFKPRVLALQNGKFILKEFGRFTLAVGTDRNISDYLLQYRADLLSSMVRFFHRDLQSIYNQFPLSEQSKNLSEKLYHIFETYLPILQHKGNIFHNVPKLRMPKTGSTIFLDAIQTLQCCQQTKGVLGGAILYHNKVVATQLDDQITKQLVLTDPLHVRTTAEHLHSVDFHIPNGVQMLVIYIEESQYQELVADAQRIQSVQTRAQKQQQEQFPQGSAGGTMPAQFTKRKIKRDQSLIFTNIPEEGPTTSAAAKKKDEARLGAEDKESELIPDDNDSPTQTEEIDSSPTPSVPPSSSSRPSLARPTHLPLRFKNMTTRELPESGIASINFDENGSFPEFIGHTSVCSTPMTENKVLDVDGHISIIANPERGNNFGDAANTPSTLDDNHRRRNSIKTDIEQFFQNFISNPNKMERRNSFTDLQDSLKKISKKLSLKKKISNSVKTDDENRNGSSTSATPMDHLLEDAEDDTDSAGGSNNSADQNKHSSSTITDPINPMFNDNGQPISRSLFQEFLERYYKLWDTDTKQQAEVADLIAEFKEFDDELQKLNNTVSSNTAKNNDGDESANPTTKANADFKAERNLNLEKVKTPLDKKSLSLPLKPISDATPSEGGGGAVPFGGFGRKQSGGIPLTPLMAKLSVLALNEERGTGWECTTPAGVEIQTPLDAAKVFRRRNSNTTTAIKCDEAVDALAAQNASKESSEPVAGNLKRVDLYICGQQNMTLLLLMEQGSSAQQPLVQSMFDICVAKFPNMETLLNEILNANVENDKSDADYSFICLDSKWGALQRSGAWNPVELSNLESIHRDLQLYDLTDLLLRSNDSVFFGYKCGRTEFFYKESAHQTTGIPPPSDPMGNIVMRAKDRLERDHSYVLL